MFDLSTGDVEIRRKVTTEEIVDIETNNAELKAVITAMDSKVYQWNYSEKLKFDEDSNFTNIDLKYPATCLHLDESLNEGLLGSLDGGILYANFSEDVFSKLVGAPSVENYVIRYKELDENLFVTFHAFGSVKLWNAINGEELHDFTYSKITCKDVLLHKGRSELYFFYDDNSCKVVDAQNFEKVTQFIIDEVNVQPGEEARYIQDSTMVHEPGQDKPYYFCVTNKGELYVSDLKEKDEINLTEVHIYPRKSYIITLLNRLWNNYMSEIWQISAFKPSIRSLTSALMMLLFKLIPTIEETNHILMLAKSIYGTLWMILMEIWIEMKKPKLLL